MQRFKTVTIISGAISFVSLIYLVLPYTFCTGSDDCYLLQERILAMLLNFVPVFLISTFFWKSNTKSLTAFWLMMIWLPFSMIYTWMTPFGHELLFQSGPIDATIISALVLFVLSFVIYFLNTFQRK